MAITESTKPGLSEAKIFGEGQHKLIYQTQGSGPPLILVHGLSGSGKWWRYNLAALAEQYTCHVVELIGYGANRAFRPVTIATAAAALAEFIALLPEGRAHVLGHSMGGHIAATLAANFPRSVDRLVLAAASGLLRTNLFAMALRLPIAAHYSPLDFLPTLARDAFRAGPLNLLLSTRDILGSDLTEVAPKILVPTLLIWGTRDNLVPLAAGEAMQKLIPDSRLEVLEGAGHVLMWDHSKAFNRLVLEFLRATPNPR
ncbi:MAG: alpha/beta hydrolase [Cytophagales bacterium]|nr:alpha/beta hydrolase [Armatimonadota bacterium]